MQERNILSSHYNVRNYRSRVHSMTDTLPPIETIDFAVSLRSI